ncbi:MAG: hypothetical protein ACYDCF_08800 [Burkholderiales bacterium]
MSGQMKPIIIGALIIAVGIFLSAQRIAYVLSFEGQLESCVRAYNSATIGKALGIQNSDIEYFGEKVCLRDKRKPIT